MVKIMILLLIAAFAGLFFIEGPGGEPIMSLQDLMPEVEQTQSNEPETVYKWQDENGVWQFSNQPRDAVIAESIWETVEYDGNINTMPAVKVPPSSSSSSASTQMSIPSGLTTVSGDQAQRVIDTVANLQQTVDDRKAKMDKLTGNN